MEAHVLRPEHLVQDAGEDVLAGVLLHLVEAPLPVDGAGDGGTGLCRSGRASTLCQMLPFVSWTSVTWSTVRRRGQRASVGELTPLR